MAKVKKQYVVIGLSNFGFTLAKTLYENGADVVAIDKDYDVINEIEPYCTHAICMDATEERNFEKLGLSNMDEALVCLASDIEASIYICISLLEEGIKRITAKARDNKHKLVLEKIGVHNVVIPELEMGRKIALNMIRPNMVEVLSLSDEFTLVEIKPPKKWVGKSVLELDIRRTEKIHILAIKREDDIITESLRDVVFEPDDILLIYGSAQNTNKLSNKATASVLED